MLRLKTKSAPAVMIQPDVKSPLLEAYSRLRININFASAAAAADAKTIAITSAHAGEGKTTTALNLAVMNAHAGKKVMLVDADLRKPSLHAALGKDNRIGLTDLLSNWTSAEDVIHEISGTGIANLSFIPSGDLPPNPSELLDSKRMDSLLALLKKTYDVVILDTSAVLGTIDAKIVAAKCDGVLVVVQHGKVKREAARKLKDELTQAKANLLGAVVNKIGGKLR